MNCMSEAILRKLPDRARCSQELTAVHLRMPALELSEKSFLLDQLSTWAVPLCAGEEGRHSAAAASEPGGDRQCAPAADGEPPGCSAPVSSISHLWGLPRKLNTLCIA